MRKDAAISVRVTPDVKEAAEKAAKEDGRTLAAYVERLLAAHLREKGYLPQ
ncbi:YlcI/YnfO family protein [Magnetospirillum aberrantis]|uniref:YlcI/YnfO family protein n=1 Tax=Magnetospirillum aberrantis TaxID=1105283 RepID=UPI0013D50498|nr:YlcI/YnfO family protein [Magnetospirillum aberrantis]